MRNRWRRGRFGARASVTVCNRLFARPIHALCLALLFAQGACGPTELPPNPPGDGATGMDAPSLDGPVIGDATSSDACPVTCAAVACGSFACDTQCMPG